MNLQNAPKREKKRAKFSHDHDGEDGCSGSETLKDSPSIPLNNGHRNVSHEDINLVQNLIEDCLKLYMTKDEVVGMVLNSVRFGKHFIDIVWQRLEEENPDFFGRYNLRLNLMSQIITFNQLLKRQWELKKCIDSYWPNGLSHKPVNSSFGNHPQRPYLPSIGTTDMESLCYGSSCHMVDGVPAECNFNFVQQNGEAAIGNHEIDIKSIDQASYEPHAFQRSSGQSMAFGAHFRSDIYNMEGIQPALDGGVGISTNNLVSHHNLTTNLTDISDDFAPFQSDQSSLFPNPDIRILDIMRGSPDECDTAHYYIPGEAPFPAEPHYQC